MTIDNDQMTIEEIRLKSYCVYEFSLVDRATAMQEIVCSVSCCLTTINMKKSTIIQTKSLAHSFRWCSALTAIPAAEFPIQPDIINSL